MQVVPTREEFLRLSRQGNVVPVRADLLADFRDGELLGVALRDQAGHLLNLVEFAPVQVARAGPAPRAGPPR